jgi:ferri-bacillibactin esterase
MKPLPTSAVPAFRARSPQTGSEYAIYVHAPDSLAEDRPGSALLFMDGDFFFDPAVAVARELAEALPPVLVVGVGYGAGFGQPGNHRGRDYTPTASALEPTSGGLEPFLAFLQETLWPELARRYPLRDDRRVIGGHSLGALPALEALFRPKPFFNRVLASAPSLWWDERVPLARLSAFRERHRSLYGSLFLSVGAEDTASMTGDLALLERQLAERPFAGLRVISEKFPGRDHYNVIPDALRAGLRALLA